MSLLNAALRKKEQENQPAKIVGLFNDSAKLKGKSGLWIFGFLACMALAVGLALPFGLNFLTSFKKKSSLSSLPPDQAASQSIMPVQMLPPSAEVPQPAPAVADDPPAPMTPQPSGQALKPVLSKKSMRKPKKVIQKPAAESREKTVKNKGDPGPTPPKSNQPDASGVFYEKAVRYHRQNRLEEAIRMYRQVLSRNPRDTDTLFNLAAAYLQKRDFSLALPILKDLSQKDPGNTQVLLNLAIARMGLDEPEAALALLEQAQRIGGGPAFELYFHKAIALSRLGRPAEAEVFYKMAGRIDPDHRGLLFNLAVLYEKMERYKEALQCYRAFLVQIGPVTDKEKEAVERRVLLLSGWVESRPEKPRQPDSPISTGDE